MLPTLPKIVPRRVIALAILIIFALVVGFILASRNPRTPNYYLTPVFAATATPK